MTVDSRHDHAATPADGPSVHVVRARKLLIGGAVGGMTASVVCLIGFTIAYGMSGLISAALAAAMGPHTTRRVDVQLHRAGRHSGTGSGALQRPPRSVANTDVDGHLPDNDHRCSGMAGG